MLLTLGKYGGHLKGDLLMDLRSMHKQYAGDAEVECACGRIEDAVECGTKVVVLDVSDRALVTLAEEFGKTADFWRKYKDMSGSYAVGLLEEHERLAQDLRAG